MYWEMEVLPPLRQCGREAGNIQREASKAARDAKTFGPINKAAEVKRSEWCDTYAQCHAVTSSIVNDWLPRLSSDTFKCTPLIRADIKVALSRSVALRLIKISSRFCVYRSMAKPGSRLFFMRTTLPLMMRWCSIDSSLCEASL